MEPELTETGTLKSRTSSTIKVKTGSLEKQKVEFDQVLSACRECGASDIHMRAGERISLRVNGILTDIEMEPIDAMYMENVVRMLLTPEEHAKFNGTRDIDTSFRDETHGNTRYRVNIGMDNDGPFATLRAINTKIKPIREIGFPNDVWREIINLERGLVLFTGATGSGKSTTLASIIDEINQTRRERIITLEDPIEYVIRPMYSKISQRELGKGLNSFHDGVKYCLRQDPDIILVGEIRDVDTARGALELSDTGHVVFSTLHTKSAAESISRYVNMFDMKFHNHVRDMLASNLAYVVSQQLIPYQNEGRSGRVLAMEIMNVKDCPAIRAKIRRDDYHQIQNDLDANKRYKMMSMDRHLQTLVEERKLAIPEALLHAYDRIGLMQRLNITDEEYQGILGGNEE